MKANKGNDIFQMTRLGFFLKVVNKQLFVLVIYSLTRPDQPSYKMIKTKFSPNLQNQMQIHEGSTSAL